MSRSKVIVGHTFDGRPVTDWEPAPVEAPRYPHMQPAFEPTITRRKATRAELQAADTEPPGYLDAKPGRRQSGGPVGGWDGMATPDRMAESRRKGAARTHAVIAAKAEAPLTDHQKKVLAKVRSQGGNRSQAARRLKVSTTAVQATLRVIARHGVKVPESGTRYGIPNKVAAVLSPRCGRPLRTGPCGRRTDHPGRCGKFSPYTPGPRGSRAR